MNPIRNFTWTDSVKNIQRVQDILLITFLKQNQNTDFFLRAPDVEKEDPFQQSVAEAPRGMLNGKWSGC